jgi:hypothetical protein
MVVTVTVTVVVAPVGVPGVGGFPGTAIANGALGPLVAPPCVVCAT